MLHKGKEVYAWKGHRETVFTRAGSILYIAHFHPRSDGCEVQAVELKTGKQLWSSVLSGSPPVEHFGYENRVTIDTDGKVLILHGNESYTRYIEFVDMQTGKTLGHKEFLNW